ncbi:MAG TPA: glycoside hydrolase family 16 protein [Solirubrobacteraceae bacterium]|nr:glycoside hydrolase family 16 protein [Solirubrobacteraceae bacterium]
MVKSLRAIIVLLASVASAGAAPGSASATARRSPVGIPGQWRLVFDDEFNGRSINLSTWNPHEGWTNQNDVTDHLSNISVRGGHAILQLASATSGAAIATNHFSLKVGEYAEARIRFAGDGGTIYNWPAWWISGPSWPSAGENDIAEGLGSLTVNYHSPAGALETGTVNGTWARRFHTYGIYRGPNDARVYWDGRLVRTYPTHDSGAPESLILTMGASNVLRFGAAGQMVVDYVRAWEPARGRPGLRGVAQRAISHRSG